MSEDCKRTIWIWPKLRTVNITFICLQYQEVWTKRFIWLQYSEVILGQTHMKVKFTVLNFGQTQAVTFTVFSFGHLYSVILNSVILTSLLIWLPLDSGFWCDNDRLIMSSEKFEWFAKSSDSFFDTIVLIKQGCAKGIFFSRIHRYE